jgi:transposase
MESTGVFWKPIVNLLEAEDIEFLVVNAQHMKALPGRKTDVKDAEWIAQPLRHGLLSEFHSNPNSKSARGGANIKLGSVVSDIMGISSKDVLYVIADGEEDPMKLANFARRTMKKKKDELELALRDYVNPHHE